MFTTYQRDIVRIFPQVLDAVFISKSQSEEKHCISLVGIYEKKNENNPFPTNGHGVEYLFLIDLMSKYDTLFDLYIYPAEARPSKDDLICVFDCGISEQLIECSYTEDRMNIRKHLFVNEVGEMIMKGEITDYYNKLKDTYLFNYNDPSTQRHVMFWRKAITTLSEQLMSKFLMSNMHVLQTFSQTSPFLEYPFNEEQKKRIKKVLQNES